MTVRINQSVLKELLSRVLQVKVLLLTFTSITVYHGITLTTNHWILVVLAMLTINLNSLTIDLYAIKVHLD